MQGNSGNFADDNRVNGDGALFIRYGGGETIIRNGSVEPWQSYRLHGTDGFWRGAPYDEPFEN
ncbi:MAG: hypothetical protein JO025_27765 [Verrucomicrobia bacterium]|nr:hypothetical protein [Verrucomicrobiota bacterium]